MKPRCLFLNRQLSCIDDAEDVQVLRESLRCFLIAVHDIGGCVAADAVHNRAMRVALDRELLGVVDL